MIGGTKNGGGRPKSPTAGWNPLRNFPVGRWLNKIIRPAFRRFNRPSDQNQINSLHSVQRSIFLHFLVIALISYSPSVLGQLLGGGGGQRVVPSHADPSWYEPAPSWATRLVPNPVFYHMKDIDSKSERFDTIYREVRDLVHKSELQKLEREKERQKPVKILQTLSPGFYRVSVDGSYYAMKIPSESSFADDEIVKLHFVVTENVYTYTTVLGANATLKIAEAVEEEPTPPTPITSDEFIGRLRAGETFAVRKGDTEIKCKQCNGFGYPMTGLRGGRPDCSECRGDGKFIAPRFILILW